MSKHDQAALDAATQIIDLFSSPGQWRDTWHLKHKVQCLLIDLLERNATQPADGEPQTADFPVAIQARFPGGAWTIYHLGDAPELKSAGMEVRGLYPAPPAAAPVAAGEPVAWECYEPASEWNGYKGRDYLSREKPKGCSVRAVPLGRIAAPPAAAHGDEAGGCRHRLADARNKHIVSGYFCVDCGAAFAAADHAAMRAQGDGGEA